MPLISTRAGASARGFSHMASSILPGFNNNSTLAVAHDGSPYVTVYKFNDVTGFGTKYADAPDFPIPAGAVAQSVDFINNTSNPALSIIAGTNSVSNSLVGYRFSTSTGFGTKYTSSAPGTYVYSTAGIPNGSVVAAGILSSPYILAVPWNVGFGTKYADPATLPIGLVYSVEFNPSGTVLLIQDGEYPYLHAYAWSSGFGTKYADPTATVSSSYDGLVKWHPSGNFFVSGSMGNVYNWSSGFGTKYADPTGKPSLPKGADWNPAGTIIAFSDDFSNKLVAYDWSSGFGTKYADGTDFPSMTVTEAFAWNPTGTAITIGITTSPYIYAYSWFNGFSRRYSNPSTLPGGKVNDVAFL